jgi:subtilisin family serine protease
MKRVFILAVLACAIFFMPIGKNVASALDSTKFSDVIIGFKDDAGDRFDFVERAGGHLKKDLRPLINAISAKVPEQFKELLERHPSIKYVEEDGIAFALGHSSPSSTEYANSWGVDHIQADLVHPANLGSGISVAVIDSGVNYKHPDLAPNYRGGHDFVNDDSDPMDDNGHGTHVAGTIAAIKDGKGVVGVAPAAGFYALKVLGSGGSGSYSDIIAALNWAVDHDIKIASMSLGGSSSSTSLGNAVKSAYDSGVLLVAAAGNDGANSILYPAAYSQVIAVGATDGSNRKASFSNYGSKIELVAPGVSIRSTVGSGYAVYSGTSMATPHVSGVAALVLSADPDSSPAEVRSVLRNTAQDLGTAGKDSTFGYGLVRADRATAGSEPAPQPSPAPDTTIPSIKITSPVGGQILPAGTVSVRGTASDNSGGSGIRTVQVRIDSGSYVTATPKAAGDWSSWSINMSMGGGFHRIYARATDNAGNQATQSILVVVR